MADPGLSLHKAVFAKLQALTTPVFDAVPQATPYPYVTLDTQISSNADYLVERKDDRFVFLTIWSEVRGQQQVLQLIGEIDALMHGAALTLDSGRAVTVRVDSSSTRRDSDNVTFGGQVILRVLTEH